MWRQWKKKFYGTITSLFSFLVSSPALAEGPTVTIGQGAADPNSIAQKVNDFLAAPGVGYIIGFFQVLAIVWLGFSLGVKMFKAAKDRQYAQLGVDAVLFILAAIIIVKPAVLIAFFIWIGQKFSGN